jgi:hypothetical protein
MQILDRPRAWRLRLRSRRGVGDDGERALGGDGVTQVIGDGGVDDQIFEVRIIRHRLEKNSPPAPLEARLKRRNTLFQSPNASGRSRQGEPVRTIHGAIRS